MPNFSFSSTLEQNMSVPRGRFPIHPSPPPPPIARPSQANSRNFVGSPGPIGSPIQSPPRDNFNRVIGGILSRLHHLQAVSLNETSRWCAACEEGAIAFTKCIQCNELLCDNCLLAHQRVSVTKEHTIYRFGANPLIAAHGSFNDSSKISNSPSPFILTICEIHGEDNRLYCETCKKETCNECMLHDHCGHELTYIKNAVDMAKTTNLKLGLETRAAIEAIRDAIDTIQHTAEGVGIRANQVAEEVRNVIRRCIVALEEREYDLIKCIDQTRQYKTKLLHNQKNCLTIALTRLVETADCLTESLATTSSFALINGNDSAGVDLRAIEELRADLAPCEDDSIIFIPPDNSILRAISTIGSVTTAGTRHLTHFHRPLPKVTDDMMQLQSPRLPFLTRPFNEINIFHLPNPTIFGGPLVKCREPSLVPTMSFGAEGEKDGQLCRPWGICCDRMGNMIIADRSNNRIQVFAACGKFLFKFGSPGTGPGQFDRPAGVAINNKGHIVVADKDNHRIQIFKADGSFLRMFGEKGTRNGQFNYPWDVACNILGHIVVTDTRNHRIQMFTSDGVFLNKYGFEGSANMWKHFDSPRGVSFMPSGAIVVTDFNNHRIVVVDSDFMQAQFLGSEGSEFKQFFRPQGVVCDDDGNIFVADSRNNRIQAFAANGTFLWSIGVAGKGLADLDRPSGICLTPDGRVVVVDFGNNRVQIF